MGSDTSCVFLLILPLSLWIKAETYFSIYQGADTVPHKCLNIFCESWEPNLKTKYWRFFPLGDNILLDYVKMRLALSIGWEIDGRLLMSLCCCDNVSCFLFKGLELQLLPSHIPWCQCFCAHCFHCWLIKLESQKPCLTGVLLLVCFCFCMMNVYVPLRMSFSIYCGY